MEEGDKMKQGMDGISRVLNFSLIHFFQVMSQFFQVMSVWGFCVAETVWYY